MLFPARSTTHVFSSCHCVTLAGFEAMEQPRRYYTPHKMRVLPITDLGQESCVVGLMGLGRKPAKFNCSPLLGRLRACLPWVLSPRSMG